MMVMAFCVRWQPCVGASACVDLMYFSLGIVLGSYRI